MSDKVGQTGTCNYVFPTYNEIKETYFPENISFLTVNRIKVTG